MTLKLHCCNFQRRYANRPIVELEAAAHEELKITELRLAKLFSSEATVPPITTEVPSIQSDKATGIDVILSVYLFFHTKLSTLFSHVCKQPCPHSLTGSISILIYLFSIIESGTFV